MTKSQPERIVAVKSLLVEHSKGQVRLQVEGETSSAGWTRPVLIKRTYKTFPSDGFQEFDFIALPPDGLTPDVLTPISAKFEVAIDISGWKGVRVYGERRFVEESL